MDLIETIRLDNGLTLEIWDESRKIAEDTVKVALTARIRVALKQEYLPGEEQYRTVRRAFGDELLYEQRNERAYVHLKDRDAVFGQLLSDFKETTMKYISRPDFASGFAKSKLMDIQRNPYKYREGKPDLTVLN